MWDHWDLLIDWAQWTKFLDWTKKGMGLHSRSNRKIGSGSGSSREGGDFSLNL